MNNKFEKHGKTSQAIVIRKREKNGAKRYTIMK